MSWPRRRSSSRRFLAAACLAVTEPRGTSFTTLAMSGFSSVILTISVARRTSACTTSSAELRSQTQRLAVSTSTLLHAFPAQGPGRPGSDGAGADGGVIRGGASAFLASAGGVTTFGSAGFGLGIVRPAAFGSAGFGLAALGEESARGDGSAGFVEAGASTVRGAPMRCAVT